MAQQPTRTANTAQAPEQPADAVRTALRQADTGDTYHLNGDDATPWRFERVADADPNRDADLLAVFYRDGVDPRRDDYDWRDDPRLLVAFDPDGTERPQYVVRQAGEGVVERGSVRSLRPTSYPGKGWSVTLAADALVPPDRLTVTGPDGDAVTLATDDELVERVTLRRGECGGDSLVEYRRYQIDGFDRTDAQWRVVCGWGGLSERFDVEAVADWLARDTRRWAHDAPEDMPATWLFFRAWEALP